MTDAGQDKSRRRILLVEDEPGLQEALALILELEGFDVARANDGREGLAHVTDLQPDLIITDYMMPYMNGLEMISRIRANTTLARIPVLLMSAAIPPSADTSQADAFLAKPAGLPQLLELITLLLKQGEPPGAAKV